MSINSDVASKEKKFVAFVAKLMEVDPRDCFANVAHLEPLSREDQAFRAFLEVLVELPETAKMLVERIGNWREIIERLEENRGSGTPSQFFQNALDGANGWPRLPFGRGRKGAYRKPTHRPKFGEALYAYLSKVKVGHSPVSLATDDWRTALSEVEGIPSFGKLAQFNYLERLCLLRITSSPREYLVSGGGPERGFEMIYGTSKSMMVDGTRMLESLIGLTGNTQSLFALETILCTMQKDRFKHCFLRLFEAPFSEGAVRDAVDCYQRARNNRS